MNTWFQDNSSTGYKIQIGYIRKHDNSYDIKWVDTDIFELTMEEAINVANSQFPNVKYRVISSRKGKLTKTQKN